MKYKNIKLVCLKITLIMYLSFLVANQLFSQNCPAYNGVWDNAEANFNLRESLNFWGYNYEQYPVVATGYQWSRTGNVFDVKVSWGTGFQLSTDARYEFTEEEKKNLIFFSIIQKSLGGKYICDYSNNLNNNVYTFNFYETVNCETEKTCYLKLNQDLRIFCKDAAFPEDEVPNYEHNYIFYFPFKKKIICGTTCCVTTYNVKCETQQNATSNGGTKRLVIQSKVKHANECAVSSNIDCHTSQTIPCTAKCSN